MATAATIEGDLLVRGAVIPQSLYLPASSVTNASVLAGAGIDASKLQHQHTRTMSQVLGVDATTEARVIHVVYGATGTLLDFRAGAVVVAGAATTVTVDLKKNGTTVLSAVITLDNSQVAYQEVAGTITSASVAAGDVLSVHLILSGANEPQGVYANLVLREDAA